MASLKRSASVGRGAAVGVDRSVRRDGDVDRLRRRGTRRQGRGVDPQDVAPLVDRHPVRTREGERAGAGDDAAGGGVEEEEFDRDAAAVTAAADAVGGTVFKPVFAPDEQRADSRDFKDFNDLATKSAVGRAAAQEQVRGAFRVAVESHRHAVAQALVQSRSRQELGR